MKEIDYPIMEYKVLNYLYEVILYGKNEVSKENLKNLLGDIRNQYFDFILSSLYESGFIKGVNVNDKNHSVTLVSNCQITSRGIHYLFESPLMKAAEEFLQVDR